MNNPNTICPTPNGPIKLRGRLQVDGRVSELASLCRCGRSQRKPYCDGSHRSEFVAEAEVRAGDTSAQDDGSVLKVTIIADGPALVDGYFQMVDPVGRVVATGNRIALCRCGASENQPFCDGRHYEAQFRG